MSDLPRHSWQSAPSLEAWGWDAGFAEAWAALGRPGEPARVLRANGAACLVASAYGEVQLPIRQGLRREASGQPTAGDWVVVVEREIAAVLERRTAVVRASSDRERAPQTLAANVDTVLVVEPLGDRWRPRHLERLLVVAWQSGGLPIVVLTKADRSDDLPAAIEAAAMKAPGTSVHAVSALDETGIDELAAELSPRTTAVILGRSGAGKSTLTNLLSGGTAGLATGEVRDDGKGRHTTVSRELVRLANGALLIDTPGLRAIGLADSMEAIGDAFSDVQQVAAGCRFNDCAHETEPGCAVTSAIESGELTYERLDSYRRLLREQARLEARDNPKLRSLQAAERRAFARQLRQMPHR